MAYNGRAMGVGALGPASVVLMARDAGAMGALAWVRDEIGHEIGHRTTESGHTS